MKTQDMTTGIRSGDVAAIVQAQLGRMPGEDVLRAAPCAKPKVYDCQGTSFNCTSGKFDCGGNAFGCPNKFTEK